MNFPSLKTRAEMLPWNTIDVGAIGLIVFPICVRGRMFCFVNPPHNHANEFELDYGLCTVYNELEIGARKEGLVGLVLHSRH